METMKRNIITALKDAGRAGLLMNELEREIPELAGPVMWGLEKQRILFWEVSEAFMAAIRDMGREIILQSTSPLTYWAGGHVSCYPVARQLNRRYRSVHWVPVALYDRKAIQEV
jgi:hypothetical protein